MRRWVRSTFKGIARYVVCPICGARGHRREQALNESMPWCATCGCEYRVTPRGATFDQSLKTERFAWGKAVNLAGGIKLGGGRKKP
jgi:hypothetical protein